jgi:alpha-mannosidase
VLFNQFHDILPGTSIPEVFVEANQAWQEVEQVGLEILEESLKAIASQIALPHRRNQTPNPLSSSTPSTGSVQNLLAFLYLSLISHLGFTTFQGKRFYPSSLKNQHWCF